MYGKIKIGFLTRIKLIKVKFLLLYNLKRIHKIVEWDDTDPFSQGIPIYDSSPNKIFKNVKIQF